MPAEKWVKTAQYRPRLVGVIATPEELGLAGRMSSPPDLFELRLDLLRGMNQLERKASALPAPLIITARHPAEGGRGNLTAAARRELLLRFLPVARYVDIELQSVRTYRTVLDRARRNGVGTIISFHDLEATPSLTSLRAKAKRAKRFRPNLFKVATRTDTVAELSRLVQFTSSGQERLSVSAMGIGKFGAVSRLLLTQYGSALVYTSLRRPWLEGQVSLEQFRTFLDQINFTR